MIEVHGPSGTERLTWEEFEAQIKAGTIAPETPVRIAAVTGARFRPAGSLELVQALLDSGSNQFLRGLRYAAPLATAGLVGLQLRVYWWSRLPGGESWLLDNAANWAPGALELGQVYRLITCGFLHLDFTHLTLNMLFLAYTGINLERALGRKNLLVLFLVSVVCGALLSMAMSASRPSLGASGGDFGLLAASVIFGWKNADLLPSRAQVAFGWAVMPYLVYPLLIGLISTSVDNWGHLGGLLGGVLFSTWVEPDALPRFQANNRSLRWTSLVMVGLLMLVLAWAGPRLLPLQPLEAGGLKAATPRAWVEGWTITDDRGWVSPTREGALVFATRTWDLPQSPDQAVTAFFNQLDARLDELEVVRREQEIVQGWPAQRLTLRFRLAGEPQHMEALVVCRGTQVILVHLHGAERLDWRLSILAERLFSRLELVDPPELTAAREAHASNPRSWRAALQHGQEATAAGAPEEALLALSRSWELARERRSVALALLELYAGYPELAKPEDLWAISSCCGEDPALAVAQAKAWVALGDDAQAVRILDLAFTRWPNDPGLRRARKARGLSPDGPAVDPP